MASDSVPFGPVVLGSRTLKRLTLENTGDIGALCVCVYVCVSMCVFRRRRYAVCGRAGGWACTCMCVCLCVYTCVCVCVFEC